MSDLDALSRRASGAACGFSPRPSASAVADRRARIAATLGDDQVLLLGGGDLRTRSADTEFGFRPDSDFYYLTGLAEPGAVMVLRGGPAPEFTLFVRAKDRDAEIWAGRRIGPQGAVEHFAADAAHPITELNERLPELLDGATRVHMPMFGRDALRRAVNRAVANLRRRNRTGTRPPSEFVEARATIADDRICKDAAALASLRRAVDITVEAHLCAMREARPGMHEFEIQALLEYQFRRRGAAGPGYGSIVGSGANATILHYVDNDGPLRDGDLLLIDAGAEFDLHSGDLTRTFPVSGRFTMAQRDLYQVVLAANEAGIADCTTGSTIEVIHKTCLRVLCEGLIELGLCEGPLDALIESEAYKRFYMHRTSHWLGADVHDAGDYCVDGVPRPLKPGYVLTVEPGLYVAPDDETAPEALRGVGIRIEDDILIGTEGPRVLTEAAPKTVAALEAIIGTAAASFGA